MDGDYSSQIAAMDANMCALERGLLNFTIWNYCSDNSHKWGDQWNGEDLSIWSPPPLKTADLDQGARALQAFVRPYPILTPGTLKTCSYDMKEGVFKASFLHRVAEDGAWEPHYEGIKNTTMEIYLPRFHYPQASEIKVIVSCGSFEYQPESQTLLWKCGCKVRNEDGSLVSPDSANSTAGSVNSAVGLVKSRNSVTDNLVEHRIVISRFDSLVSPDIDEEEQGICPRCSVM